MTFHDTTHQGKTYIVTGGASGVGRAAAVQLAGAGANVVVADSNVEAGQAVAESAGPTATFVETDLVSLDSIRSLVDRTVTQHGTIDGLANVAAVYRGKPFLETSVDDWELIDHVNHRAVYFLTQAVVRTMIDAGTPGSIVNVASGAAFRPVPGQSAYAGTKGGVVALTRNIADELKPHGIRVNVMAPGHTASETVRSRMSEEQMQAFAEAKLLWKRWMSPEEVAEGVTFLLGDLSRGMTGATLNVNLGDYMPH